MSTSDDNEVLSIPVRAVMRQPPVIVPPSESVASLMFTLVKANIGAVVVVEKSQAVGMITERDVLERAISREKDLYKTQAKDIMSKPVISIESNYTIRQALELMQKHQIRRLAVTQDQALVGMVTERRLLVGILNKVI